MAVTTTNQHASLEKLPVNLAASTGASLTKLFWADDLKIPTNYIQSGG